MVLYPIKRLICSGLRNVKLKRMLHKRRNKIKIEMSSSYSLLNRYYSHMVDYPMKAPFN